MSFSVNTLKPYLGYVRRRLSGVKARLGLSPPAAPSLPLPYQRAINDETGTVFVIDFPYREVGFPIEYYAAWCHVEKLDARIEITANHKPVRLYPLHRPDLTEPQHRCFSIYFELHRYLDVITGDQVTFRLLVDGRSEAELVFRVASYIFEPAQSFIAQQSGRRAFLQKILQCPACHLAQPQPDSDELVCGHCGQRYPQDYPGCDWPGLTLINGDIEQTTRLVNKTDLVSTHVYPPRLLEKIEQQRAAGGWVLDVGAGLRRQTFANLICVEIFDYPSTDVRSTGESLPFADDSFDLVISNAVLEHVPHPFRDAGELLRVLKPGGELHVMVPFLQPEHGYPFHYFNMTRSGVLQLFGDGIDIDAHFIEDSNEPMFALHWFLSVYLNSLPEPERVKFSAMTVNQLVARHPQEFLNEDIVTALSEQGRWALASGHTLIARKKQ